MRRKSDIKPTEIDYWLHEMAMVNPSEHIGQIRVYKRRSMKADFEHINYELDCLPLSVLENRKARGAYELG